MRIIRWQIGLIIVAVSGCSSIPQNIQDIPAENIQLLQVKPNVQAFKGKKVRWGGEIVSIKNADNKTTIELVQYRLKSNGKPIKNASSDGRFMVTVDGFLEPVVYSAKRLFTAVGYLDGQIEGLIDQQPYQFPMLSAESYYLWPNKNSRYRYQGYPYNYRYYPYYDYFGFGFHGYH